MYLKAQSALEKIMDLLTASSEIVHDQRVHFGLQIAFQWRNKQTFSAIQLNKVIENVLPATGELKRRKPVLIAQQRLPDLRKVVAAAADLTAILQQHNSPIDLKKTAISQINMHVQWTATKFTLYEETDKILTL